MVGVGFDRIPSSALVNSFVSVQSKLDTVFAGIPLRASMVIFITPQIILADPFRIRIPSRILVSFCIVIVGFG